MDAENPFQDVAELIQPNPTADDSQFEAPEQPEVSFYPVLISGQIWTLSCAAKRLLERWMSP